MGVKSCYRKDCENIMCNTYIDGVGYICDECQTEFQEYLKKREITLQSEGEIKRQLKKFMETEKDSFYEGKGMNVNEFFNSYTRDR